MAKIVAIANQKGGVGKTTTAINLGAALGAFERRILLVDCDPQGNATRGLGLQASAPHLYQVLVGEAPIRDAIRGVRLPEPRPAALRPGPGRRRGGVRRHRGLAAPPARVLAEVADDYDVILLDCPPSLGHLTVNALVGRRRRARAAPVRVLRPRGHQRADGHRAPGPGRRSTRPGGRRRPADHVRRPDQPLEGRGGRDPPPLRRPGVPGRGAAQRPPRRGAEPRPADLRIRHQVPRRRGVSRPRPGVHARGAA